MSSLIAPRSSAVAGEEAIDPVGQVFGRLEWSSRAPTARTVRRGGPPPVAEPAAQLELQHELDQEHIRDRRDHRSRAPRRAKRYSKARR